MYLNNFCFCKNALTFPGNQKKWKNYSENWQRRQTAISNVLWNPAKGVWQDLDIGADSHRDYFYASNILPLFASCKGKNETRTENTVLSYLQVRF